MNKFRIEKRGLSADEYQLIRKTTGWIMLDDDVVSQALKNDLFTVCAFDDKKLIGIGRVIGDGSIYFYIQDVIVTPEYQKKGVGKHIMESIEEFLNEKANNHSFIGLMAAEGVKEFYYAFGYKERPAHKPGMYKFIKK